jgi:hypothetical protein
VGQRADGLDCQVVIFIGADRITGVEVAGGVVGAVFVVVNDLGVVGIDLVDRGVFEVTDLVFCL